MPNIRVLTANSSLEPLRLAAELRSIKWALSASSNFVVIDQAEARPSDLVRLLGTEKPEVVHIAGHGGTSAIDRVLRLTGVA